MGKIYDDGALDRVRGWVDLQEQNFIDSEKDKNVKQWLVLGSVSILAGVIMILIVKKLTE